jgi:uncharacterized protein
MIIDIDKVPKDGLSLSRNFEFPSLDLVEEEAVFLRPVHAEATIKRLGDEIRIQGRIQTVLSFVCGRCLAPYEVPVDSRFDLVFLPEEVHDPKEELDDTDLDRLFYKSRQLDMREVILEQLNLTFPAKPLCATGCEGICAVCGKVRRDGDCGCHVKEADIRLDSLKSLKKDR